MNVLLSTAYFPPIEYFAYIIQNEHIIIDLYETYPKQTWRNRCRVVSASGTIDLSIPVEKPYGNRTLTHQITISDHYPWRKNHWRTIYSAYRNSPFFIYYSNMAEQLIMETKTPCLSVLNTIILENLLKELEIEKTIKYTESFMKDVGDMIDARFYISPKNRDRKQHQEPDSIPYYQPFSATTGFQPNASILDLLFNVGPDSILYLNKLKLNH